VNSGKFNQNENNKIVREITQVVDFHDNFSYFQVVFEIGSLTSVDSFDASTCSQLHPIAGTFSDAPLRVVLPAKQFPPATHPGRERRGEAASDCLQDARRFRLTAPTELGRANPRLPPNE
jgi:hypothetical protein